MPTLAQTMHRKFHFHCRSLNTVLFSAQNDFHIWSEFIYTVYKDLSQVILHFQQECIPVGCVPPAAVAVPGGLHQTPPGSRHPSQGGTPQTRHPPDQAPPDQAPPCGQTHACKHITLPQTSFAGGNNKKNFELKVLHLFNNLKDTALNFQF